MMHIYAPLAGGLIGPGVRYPGFRPLDPLIRHELHCGEARYISFNTGDLLTLINSDGGATALLWVFDEWLQPGFTALGLEALPDQTAMLSGFDSRDMRAWLEAKEIAVDTLKAKAIFDTETTPAERFTIQASEPCTLWVASPLVEEAIVKGGGGSFELEIALAQKPNHSLLPEPLGEIRDEFRIDRASAKAYQVQEGDYIQIIDVEGQQCSDFMAMRASALDQGLERHIDSTVTRTMVGGAYPGPGLFDKFYDQDIRPLLNVVQDTVGRHDTFALACTARGYEERGFPGHINCSDNISAAYAPYGIKERHAWPAINFFFNSHIMPGQDRLTSDEAWSRPGDYVLMRAMTDLVCASTACPDDVDPINGWNPTDIHVRIYKPDRPIRRSVAHRPFAESSPTMVAESAFHPRTSALTRNFQVARDLWLPANYEGTRTQEEYWACRQAVTVQDMSSLRKFDIMGPDAERLLQYAMSRNVVKLAQNRGVYALLLNETGAVLDDGTLFRLAPDVFRWCCGSDESGRKLRELAEEQGLRVWIKALWSSMPNLAVQGPKSRELMQRLVFTQPTHPAVETMRWFGYTIARLYNRDGPVFMLTRTGYTGELGYEIFCDASAALPIWDALMHEGADLGITPMGGEALEIIRIEAGLMAAGAEFAPDVDAYEAGLGFAVDMKKDTFLGRQALARNATAPRRKLVGLCLEGYDLPAHGDPVMVDRTQVGIITSATRSPMLEASIAMARVAIEYAEVGRALEIGRLDGQMKRFIATVCDIPFVDPKRERARA